MSDWVTVCRVEDIPRLGARRVAREAGAAVAVFRTADDGVFALLDRCPHKGGPLSQGIVFGESVACPLHNWTCLLYTSLEFSAGLYGSAKRFGLLSRQLCFGLGEGLPGEAWQRGRPVVLKQFEGANFRRTQAASEAGLTCGIALPIFAGDFLTAVLVIFCGDDQAHAGAIELWANDSLLTRDLTLADGYYGTTADAFEFISRRTAFRKGTGLPGLAWAAGLPVFQDCLLYTSRCV